MSVIRQFDGEKANLEKRLVSRIISDRFITKINIDQILGT